jgi:NADPH2:quinone reductase
VTRAVERHVVPLLASGRVKVVLEATFPFSEAETAYERFAAGHKFGKVVLAAV